MGVYKNRKLVVFDEPKYVRNRWLLDMFNRYEEYYRNEIQRMIINQKMYWGINFGQWPSYVVEKLIAQGRKPPTFNILAKKIESQIGSYLSNGFDLKFETRNGKESHWSLSIMDMVTSDRSVCDWESSEIIALRDMHVMVGYERMFISDKNDADFGNIGFEALPPTHIFIDPGWKTVYSNDIKNYFEYGEYTVADIILMYPKMADKLKELRLREELNCVDYGEFVGGPQRYRDSDQKWGSTHRVITFHSVVKEVRNWEYDLVNRNPFPDTGHEFGSKEDVAIKEEYKAKMGLQEGDWVIVKQNRNVKRIETICPSLDNEMFLTTGRDRIQTNNCNIYPCGNNFYGQFRGVCDDLADVQLQFNKGKMNIEDIQARTAKGAFILDKALTGGDEAIREQIESNWNNPAARIWVDEGSTAELGNHGGVIELKSHPPTPDMFTATERNLDLADWLSTMPAAMDSRTESSSESGKLVQTKIQMGMITQKYGMKIYERHKREKLQAYPLQAKLTYSGYPREFRKNGGGGHIVVNQPGVDVAGNRVIINDISMMPEMNLILTPSVSGVTVRSELRSQYTETLNLVAQDPADRLLKLILIKNIYMTQDMGEEDRDEVKRACSILLTIEAKSLAIKLKQIDMTAQKMMAPPPPEEGEMPSATPGQFDEQKAIAATPQDQYQTSTEGAPQ